MMQQIQRLRDSSNNLSVLDLNFSNVDSNKYQIKQFKKLIREKVKIVRVILDLTRTNVSKELLNSLFKRISKIVNLEHLQIAFGDSKCVQMKDVFGFLSNLQNVISFKMSCNFSNNQDVLYFSEFLSKMQKIKSLMLEIKLQYQKEFKEIKQVIAKMENLEQLSLNVNQNSCLKGSQYFKKCISTNNNIEFLSLNLQLIQYESSQMKKVIQEIQKAKNLKVLKLALKLDEYQLYYLPFYYLLFEIFSQLKQLNRFYLHCDYLRNEECKFILSELSKIESIKYVYISGLNVKSISQMQSFFESLNNKFDLNLDLTKYRKGFPITNQDYQQFLSSLHQIKNLQTLQLQFSSQYLYDVSNLHNVFSFLTNQTNLKNICLDISDLYVQKRLVLGILLIKSLNCIKLIKCQELIKQNKQRYYRKLLRLVHISAQAE